MLQTAMAPTLGAAGEQIFTDAQLLALIGRYQKSAIVMLNLSSLLRSRP